MGIDTADLRSMVRDVLREAMASRGLSSSSLTPVRMTNDADLQAFVARLSVPGVIEAVRAGTMKFSLAHSNPTVAASSPPISGHGLAAPALDGVVSERKLAGIAHGTKVRLTSHAVVTPMAKDIARRLRLTFERID